MKLFDFGRNNRLSICGLCNLRGEPIGHWLSGRVFGLYVSYAWKNWRTSRAKWDAAKVEGEGE